MTRSSTRILVTGGTGFIGSHTVIELLAEGHTIEILDNLSNSSPSVIDRIAEISGVQVPLHVLDIRDRERIGELVSDGDFDAVFHFAGHKAVGESVASPLEYFSNNVGGTISLLQAMHDGGVRTMVFSSSATVYGNPLTVPVSETTPTASPANPYGRTKLMIEEILADLFRSDPRWNIGILRYFNPVGAHPSGLIGEAPTGTPNNLMPYLTQVAVGILPCLQIFGDDYPTPDGTGIRDFIHVVDLAKGHTAAYRRMLDNPTFAIWNLGTGKGTSVLELISEFETATGLTIPRQVVGRREGDVPQVWADVSLALRELGWKATLSTTDMCRDAWNWERTRLR